MNDPDNCFLQEQEEGTGYPPDVDIWDRRPRRKCVLYFVLMYFLSDHVPGRQDGIGLLKLCRYDGWFPDGLDQYGFPGLRYGHGN